MADVLHVEKREQTGSAASRRLRQSGQVPAVLYGHGQGNEHLAIPQTDVSLLLRHHGKMVELQGAVKETALVSELHWDPLGIDVLHMDLQRVNLNEMVEVAVPIHIHGEPAGTREGGMFLENQHQVDIRCSAGSIPEHVVLHVSDLHLGDNSTAADLELPDGVELMSPPDLVLAQVVAPKGGQDDDEEGDDLSEPEVISKGGESEKEGGDDS
ncbi:MAG: 50S ribosomal protein L25 [Pirellulaceae bacterium]|nr:50S ribosomal protein L25 [Pirellulaceae bacterium]